ncbi:hypothetical protein PRAC110570_07795 [Propionibacterium acidifaciens]
MLDAVGIGGYVEKLPDQLPGASSSGWPWRAPVKRPRLLLADEPAGALDEGSAEQVMDLMREPQRSFGTALIMATHDALVVRHASVGRRLASGHVEVVREREGSGTRSPRSRWASARFPLGSAWGMAGRLVLLRAVAAVAPASSCGACPAMGTGPSPMAGTAGTRRASRPTWSSVSTRRPPTPSPRSPPRRVWTRRSPDTIAKGRTGVEGRRDLAVSVVPAPATIDDQAVGRLVLRVHRERRSSEGRARDGPLARPRRFGGRDLRRGSRAGAASRLHDVARGGHGADSPSSWSSAGPVQPTRHRNTVASAAHRGRRSSAHPARVPRHRSAGGGRIQPRRRLLPLLPHCDDDVHGLGGPS